MDAASPRKNKISYNLTQDLGDLQIIEGETTVSKRVQGSNDIASKIVQAMGNRKINKDFEDCRVLVDGTIFSCHSFVLISCSEFFRRKLRSNIKEKKDMTVRLSSMSASTFQLILDTIYTGENLLTVDNIVDVWKAVQLLQIDFMIKLCEDFDAAPLSLDNLLMYKGHSEKLHVRRVRLGFLEFIKKNFLTLKNTDLFLNLDILDLKQILESDDLLVDCEDLVLKAVYEWVNSNENDRKKCLAQLLLSTRYCAASASCIAELSEHSLTLNDSQVKEIFNRASAFKLFKSTYGFWPTAAINRNCWGCEHVCVYCSTEDMKFVHISLKENKVMEFKDIPNFEAIKLAVVKDKLFACRCFPKHIDVFTLEMNQWRRVCRFHVKTTPDMFLFMLAQNNCIFIFSKQKMRSFVPDDGEIIFQESAHDIASPQHAISINNQILLFGSVDYDGAEETTVHLWCSETKTWSHLASLLFTATDMVSFEDETNWYILDPHGHFWKLTRAEPVAFAYIGKLWNVRLKLTGALLFRKSLHVFVNRLDSAARLNFKYDLGMGIFQDIKIHNTNVKMSNVLHLVKK